MLFLPTGTGRFPQLPTGRQLTLTPPFGKKHHTSTSPLSELHALKSKEDPKSNKVNCRRQLAEMVGNHHGKIQNTHLKLIVFIGGLPGKSLRETPPFFFSHCEGQGRKSEIEASRERFLWIYICDIRFHVPSD